MVGDGFRFRTDTRCTADSRDSGIDVRSRLHNMRVSHGEGIPVIEDGSEKQWDLSTVLWIIVFLMTMWFFRLPMSIWFSPKVDWSIAIISIPCFGIFCSCGFWMYTKHRSTSRWHILSPCIFMVAWIAFGCGVASFSLSTWSLLGWWSLYIAGITLMFVISIASLLS